AKPSGSSAYAEAHAHLSPPFPANGGVPGKSSCQHGVGLAGRFAESTPGLSGRAQRSLMAHCFTGHFTLRRTAFPFFRAVVLVLRVSQAFRRTILLCRGFAGC